jgi:hypothetical protein
MEFEQFADFSRIRPPKTKDLAQFVAFQNTKVRATFEAADEVYRTYRTLYCAHLAAGAQDKGPVEWIPLCMQ